MEIPASQSRKPNPFRLPPMSPSSQREARGAFICQCGSHQCKLDKRRGREGTRPPRLYPQQLQEGSLGDAGTGGSHAHCGDWKQSPEFCSTGTVCPLMKESRSRKRESQAWVTAAPGTQRCGMSITLRVPRPEVEEQEAGKGSPVWRSEPRSHRSRGKASRCPQEDKEPFFVALKDTYIGGDIRRNSPPVLTGHVLGTR